MLRSRRDIENVDKQLVQLIVLVSMLPTVPGMLVLVEYSNDEIRPMVATALPALDWFSGRPACPRRPHCPRCPTHNTHTHNHPKLILRRLLSMLKFGPVPPSGDRLQRGFQPASSLFNYEATQNRMQDPRIPKKVLTHNNVRPP